MEVLASDRPSLSGGPASPQLQIIPDGPELWRLYQQQGDAHTENALIESYLPLVRFILNRLAGTLPESVDRDDLQSAGLLGLLDALRKFDFTSGVPFDSYAHLRIRGAMLDEMRRMDWVPRAIHQKSKQVQKVIGQLEQQLGRAPAKTEIAGAMKLSPAECEELFDEIRPVQFIWLDSANEGDGEEENFLGEAMADPDQIDPVEQVSASELKQVIFQRLEQLPATQRQVLTLYYIEDLNLREIAEVLGLTEGRICQIHTQAIHSVRAYLKRYENGLIERHKVAAPVKHRRKKKPVRVQDDSRHSNSRIDPELGKNLDRIFEPDCNKEMVATHAFENQPEIKI
jgi:RNA polymerase sigma factor FliA